MTDTSLEQTQSSAPLNFTFTAKEEIFGIAKKYFPSILTLEFIVLGKVEITKYLYNNTRFQIIILIITNRKRKIHWFLKAVGILLVYGI